MNPNIASFGNNVINSQGAISGNMRAGVPAPGQLSPQSPNFQGPLQAPQNPPMPNKSPTSAMHLTDALKRRNIDPGAIAQLTQSTQPQVTLPIQDQNPQQPGVQVPQSEAELIIKALTDRMKTLGKHESAVRDHLFNSNQPDMNSM